VRLDGVGKRYGLRQPWIVRDVSIEVPDGQLIRLEGRNGSGKSTLLRIAAGISAPSAGRVSGRPATGYVPERFPGGLAFSAREYLTHMGRIHGLRGPAAGAAADDWLGQLGAADYAGSPLRTLSKGMCQKVAIAQALMSEPGLLVLDEAWTGLDQAARGTLDAAVAERLAHGGTVMFVDHHQARLAGQVSQRWQLGGGRVRTLDGPGGAVAAGAGSDGAGKPVATVVIELSGLDTESVPQLARMPGVVSVRPVPGKGGGTGGERAGGPVAVRAVTLAAASDAVLRQLLGWDDVHVIAVRPGLDPAAGGAEAGGLPGGGTGGLPGARTPGAAGSASAGTEDLPGAGAEGLLGAGAGEEP
jgi:ABC-2 type transport system ATP-binding protein